MMQKPLFVTGNAHKAEQFERLLSVALDHQKLDVDEIQSKDPAEVVEHKVRQAYAIVKRPVFVDDFSFGFDELDGLPGPFIKFFIGSDDKLEKLCRIGDILPTRRVTARAYFGYYDGKELTVLYGEAKGVISDHPRSTTHFGIGTDAIFEVDGYDGKTRSELDREQYDEVYNTVRASARITEFLKQQGYK